MVDNKRDVGYLDAGAQDGFEDLVKPKSEKSVY